MNIFVVLTKHPILLLLLIALILISIFYKQFRGFMGEFWVKMELNKLPKDKYIILNDIMIKLKNGTHQIDHIVISKYGIFVIEMKNFYGLITGSEFSSKWVQHLGKNKYYFNNPIHQNYGHIKALEEILDLDENTFISVICISNQATVKVNAKNVTQVDFIDNLIKSYNKEILSANLNEIRDKIEENNIIDRKIRREHVKNIKSNVKRIEKDENDMICPKCGGKLIERTGKYGKFIGCSNYPKCRFTMKL